MDVDKKQSNGSDPASQRQDQEEVKVKKEVEVQEADADADREGCWAGCCGVNEEGLPIDRGYAWIICLAAAIIYFLTQGFGKAIGVVLLMVQSHFMADPSVISIVGAMLATGLYIFTSVMNGLGQLYGYRPVVLVSSFLVFGSLLATAFASNVVVVMFTLGLLPGLGFSGMFGAPMVLISFYFHRRRALAAGLALAGASVGAMVYPQIINYVLNEYGYQGTMMILSALSLHALPAGMLLIPLDRFRKKSKGASGAAAAASEERRPGFCVMMGSMCKKIFDKELLCDPLFIYFLLLIGLAHGAYIMILLYMPSAILEVSGDPDLVYLGPTILGACDFIGRLLCGALADVKRIPKNVLVGSTLVISGFLLLVASVFPQLGLVPESAQIILLMTANASAGLLSGAYMALLAPVIAHYFGVHKVSAGFGLVTLIMAILIIPLPIVFVGIAKSTGTFLSIMLISACLKLASGILFFFMGIFKKMSDVRKARARARREQNGDASTPVDENGNEHVYVVESDESTTRL